MKKLHYFFMASALMAQIAFAQTQATADLKPLALDGDTITAIYAAATGKVIYAGGLDKNQLPAMFYSQDGNNFKEVPLPSALVGSSVNAIQAINGVIWIGTQKGLFITNGDSNFKEQDDVSGAVNIMVAVSNQVLLVGTTNGLYVSTDSGKTFSLNESVTSDTGSFSNVTGIAVSDNTVYVALGGSSSDVSHMGYGAFVKSTPVNGLNAQTTFKNQYFYQVYGLEAPQVNSLFIDKAHSNKLNMAVNGMLVQCSDKAGCGSLQSLPSAHYLGCVNSANGNTYCASDIGLFNSSDGVNFSNITAHQHLFYTNNGQNFYQQALVSNGQQVYAGFVNNANVGEGIYLIS